MDGHCCEENCYCKNVSCCQNDCCKSKTRRRVSEEEEKQPFDPKDPPYNSKNYDKNALEPEKQEILDEKKLSQIQENENYLHDHPEIRGFISMILRHLLETKPWKKEKVQELVGKFFWRPCPVIAQELLYYLLENNLQSPLIEQLKQEIGTAPAKSQSKMESVAQESFNTESNIVTRNFHQLISVKSLKLLAIDYSSDEDD